MVPFAAEYPSAFGKLRGKCPDPLNEFLRCFRVAQVDGRKLLPGLQEMNMRVIKTRDHKPALSVYHPGLRADQRFCVGIRADNYYPVAYDRYRTRRRAFRIDRLDVGVRDHQVGSQCLSEAGGKQSKTEDGGENWSFHIVRVPARQKNHGIDMPKCI